MGLIDLYKKTTVDLFGERKNGDKCAFCGDILNPGKYCKCQKAAKVNRYYRKVNKKISELSNNNVVYDGFEILKYLYCPKLPKNFEGYTFADYETTFKTQEQVLKAVQEYHAKGIENYIKGINMILFGNYGTGKTLLMTVLCRSLVEDYMLKCEFINVIDLMNTIKNSFRLQAKENKSVETILAQYKEADVLFLDDVDKAKPTEFLNEVIYAIVNYRTENELPTIISANHNPEELDTLYFGEAIVSRLVNTQKSILVYFSQQNYRLGGV